MTSVLSPSLDEIVADPSRALGLSHADKMRLQLQCAAVLAALAVAPEQTTVEKLLEPAEAARKMNVGRTTVYEMLRDGRLRFVTKGKRGKLIPESEVDDWKVRNLRCGAAPAVTALDATVVSIESRRRKIGIDSETPPPIREGGVATRLQERRG